MQELHIIADMSNIKLEETLKINEICDILSEYYEEIHDSSPLIISNQ